MKGMEMPMKQMEKMPAKSALQPAEGASVKIVSPKAGEVLKGDQVPLEFKLTKGKRGAHVHAYVDGEMMGMFQTRKRNFKWHQSRASILSNLGSPPLTTTRN